eukprot:1450042-Pleurochrysis_carterae.AAC.1
MREASVSERRACISGTIQNGACRLCKKMGDDSAPRSAGCSSMYSAPAEWAARRSWAVRRTISFACANSRAGCDGVSGRPMTWSRSRTGGGPPSAELAAE